ncbi:MULTISPECIES: NUDIX hydrolase [Psychrilyobacter]|uniref:NUDIX domain-containing protein n=1 Tax=Psychrilyobacter piezotolerans TaxID=2293438 RepID=A0ABX9KFC8_9FUSO|nr:MULTISPECIES: NUDIX domain-containing protein [Psychrilyobacter]MCS5422163.1 NUDIX domain-containing protein [Psychrilyobacter sp. S5]NDI78514.1 NUDIX domain-containing protein [Psychrilyobacter piezotolerans]RDE60475.1 NUDIX domain-containing protein [Psychrilyobacter sp. S5]REI40505.1 NUDIX domain-containing protein [Psychrilyobacter piezotolerans]
MKERIKMYVAVHLFIIKENKILLLRRYNTGYEDGNYSVPAGHVDGNETFIEAAIREAKEETGIIIKKEEILPIQVMHRKKSFEERIDYFLETLTWKEEIRNMEPHKCDKLEWFEIDKLPENTIPYIKYAIENYKKKSPFTTFGWE